MNAFDVYTLLQDACRMLDEEGDHAIAAHVSMAMSLVGEKYDIAREADEPPMMPAGIASQSFAIHHGDPHA